MRRLVSLIVTTLLAGLLAAVPTGASGGQMRSSVALPAVTDPPPASPGQDFDGDGLPDVVGVAANGDLQLFPGTGTGGWGARRVIGTGWRLLDEVRIAGDVDGDGHPDLTARRLDGTLWLYSGDGTGAIVRWRQVGTGWSGFSDVLTPGDWDADGHVDLIGLRRDDATLWLYPGDGSGGWRAPVLIGTGWGARQMLTPVGDFDGDAHPDLIARDPGGRLWLYRSDGAGRFLGGAVIGTGWQGFTALLGPGDFSGDGAADVLARRLDGSLWLYPGTGTGGFTRPYAAVGSGWNSVALNEPTRTPRRVITYSVAQLGAVGADLGQFARHVAWTLNDPRGWSLGGEIRFDEVASGGMLRVYLASPAAVDAAGPVCSSVYSCRVGSAVYLNDTRWRLATPTFASFSRSDYQHYVVIHEVGHYLGLGHAGCPAAGSAAPVMMQQSISLGGCRPNIWPLSRELSAVRARWL